MSQFIKNYKKYLLKHFFKIPVWLLRIIFPQKRLKIRGFKIDFQSYAYINLNPVSTLHTIQDGDLPKIRKIIESNKINSRLSLNPKMPVKTKDHFVFSKTTGANMLLREYIPSITSPYKTILFFHGGGWSIDSVETYNDMIKYFSDYLNIKIFSLEYSLAPENKFPYALQEAEDAFNWLINNGNHPNQISIFGDSAGAHMVASLSYKLLKQDSEMPNSLLMIYPPCDPLFQKESIELFKDKYFLLNQDLFWFWDKLKFNEENENDPLFNHLKFDLKKKLPPTILVTAGFDPICDEGNEYAEIVKKQGTNIKVLNYPTLFHNFAFMTKLKAAKKAVHDFLDEYKKIV
tara:strand:- start:783 stop:1820 length:1038 start_codon:yes stop_codon:yes gene_type:complete